MTKTTKRKLTLQALPHGSYASITFDLLRGIAAIYVMVFHFREQLFVGAANMRHPGILVKALYLATSVGYEFVMAFFVLSGFLISSSVLRAIRSNQWSWKTYLINRVTRLWIVLIPALFLTLVVDKITSLSISGMSFYGSSMDSLSLVGNLFFLQGILVPIYGMNGPLWSLSYEFWYYILFPCIVLILLSQKLSHKIAYGVLTVALIFFLGKVIMLYFVVWLLGTMLAVLPPIKLLTQVRQQRLLTLLVGLLTVVVMVGVKYVQMNFHQSGLYTTFPSELCVGMAFAVLLYVLLHTGSNRFTSPQFTLKISTLISGFSYTLYLTHYPVVLALRNFFGYEQWVPSVANGLKGVSFALAILLYAWMISRVTEAKTGSVRRLVLRLLVKNESRTQQRLLSTNDSKS